MLAVMSPATCAAPPRHQLVDAPAAHPGPAPRADLARARVITDEGGLIFGVVVRLNPAMSEAQARGQALATLQAHERLDAAEAHDSLARMRSTVQPYRWVPRDDGGGVRPHLEEADAGSRGSWLGIYWSYP
jgi:hypothetical protein